ncbi:serine--tRNA ligase, mitochondrial isoform X2 [Sitophilus oryzae]|uniref:serine--tRNA ligase n=1 Tax=Sitophilus oryzae TaxID=7048 RepID=A0A6J2XQI1_SITOR|nr:serine--tRNA ligase, mitochondrial isoform X1 [Sitophilus oryzae]XP_030753107.1 serine--tRNA ligase, mitochondrial isoform X2 [Sitophilus oryzae]
MSLAFKQALAIYKKSAKNEYLFLLRKYGTNSASWNIPKLIEIDKNYLCNSHNIALIQENILKRKGVGDIILVNELYNQLNKIKPSDINYKDIEKEFYKQCLLIPNKTHPDLLNLGEDPHLIKYVGKKKEFDFPYKEFPEICKRLNLARTDQLGSLSGSKSYYLLGKLAELEQALVRYFLVNLLKNSFQLISVPDILPRNVIESCGMNTRGDRTQVYSLNSNLHGPDLCLSGTSEIALAGYLAEEVLDYTELPLKLCSVSRCYRAETSNLAEEKGIYRVHEFTKVEMFIVTTPDTSDQMLDDIRKHQEEFFESLELHFQVLDMPPHELGAQAYRKYDIEAWMPGRNMYGEISSCSNCTDFQSRRLNIKYKKADGTLDYVHTLNGTACAVPRLLISLVETHQQSNGTIYVPTTLEKFLNGKEPIKKQKFIPQLLLIKNKK